MNKKIIISTIMGGISGIFGLIGITGFCCTIFGGALLSFLGLASLSSYFVYYDKWLLLASAILFGLSFYFYKRYKNGSCKLKNNK